MTHYLDGAWGATHCKEARVTKVEVTFGPGVAGKPHRRPGPIFGYVFEGEFELAFDDQPMRTL